ncbi:Crp/Fnr family transcriptional regulator [Amycolatopsis sp. CB00013]|uniref:Crp/Fnr family transcriptional regulator n=1 Tax=Amycolatopsis sp. CB00013 TaxID=1703945 RepID=UPI00130115DC|nr:Crp/Fnr family transcriptional regulator [Amycolatopsis sp. CB00013]
MPDDHALRGFRALVPERTWSTLCKLGFRRAFSKGEPIFVRGAPASSVLLLTSGRVEVGCHTEDGDYRLIALRGAGDVIGEVAFEVGGVRTADVFALEPCAAFAVPLGTFERVLVADGVHRELGRYVAAKLQRAGQDSVDMLSLPPLRRIARLMVQLADLAEPGHDPRLIPLSQTRLGHVLGLSRSLVAGLVAQLRQEGILSAERNLTIERFDKLRRHAYPNRE